jgi:biopolymer transport protein ExbD
METDAMKFKPPAMRRARIEIVPMIDTIFFLLVFFMIAWLSMVKMNGLGLQQPRQNRSASRAPHAIALSVSASGGFYVNAKRASSTEWASRLKSQLAAHPGSVVVLNVAPTQRTQTLVSLLDAVNGVVAEAHVPAQVVIATPQESAAGMKEVMR